jgi:trans-aconitate 2-methyltransferase
MLASVKSSSASTVENWNPEQYERFKNERTAPFVDLLDLVERRPEMRVVDLGCGTGELTELAHERLASSTTLGIDSSAAMLERARERQTPTLRFEQQLVQRFSAEHEIDLVLSNAALHWVDDHPGLFERMTAWLAPGGQIAVQMPANDAHLSQVTARELAAREPFASALSGATRVTPVLELEEYALLLAHLGYAEQQVRAQIYLHRLAHSRQLFEWVKGTVLTWYAGRLEPSFYARFVEEYRELLQERLGPADDPYLLTYRRILLHASLPV